ncbi:MAG: nucleotidyltransferase domain-containing protein [Magnetococcales bacterium]|nr:nucleotidyltransferase domain-containing protein [Magnetococcales bacterium]
MKTLTDADLAAISDSIVELVHPERIILFGSLSRGEANEDSDIDLLVVVDEGFEGRSRWRELERIRKGIARFPMPKDILLYSREEVARWSHSINHIVAHALQEGKPLYERH